VLFHDILITAYGKQMHNTPKRIWKEMAMVTFSFPRGPEKNHKNIRREKWCNS
jgi:hypothetical protein